MASVRQVHALKAHHEDLGVCVARRNAEVSRLRDVARRYERGECAGGAAVPAAVALAEATKECEAALRRKARAAPSGRLSAWEMDYVGTMLLDTCFLDSPDVQGLQAHLPLGFCAKFGLARSDVCTAVEPPSQAPPPRETVADDSLFPDAVASINVSAAPLPSLRQTLAREAAGGRRTPSSAATPAAAGPLPPQQRQGLRSGVAAPPRVLRGHSGWVTGVGVTRDGTKAFSAGADRTLRAWDAASGAETLRLEGHTGGMLGVCVAPGARVVAGFGFDETLRLWDVHAGTRRGVLRGCVGAVSSAAFCGDGAAVASGSYDRSVRLWDVRSGGAVRHVSRAHAGAVTGVAATADGRVAVSCGNDGALAVWDLRGGDAPVAVAVAEASACHVGGATGVSLSPDGTVVASVGADETLRLWDAKSLVPRGCLRGHAGGVLAVAWSGNGQRIVTGGKDATVRVWDAGVAGEAAMAAAEAEVLKGHRSWVSGVAVSHEGSHIVSCGIDETARMWEL